MPFEPSWRFLIWRLRRGYYSTDIASTGKTKFGVFGKIRQIFPVLLCVCANAFALLSLLLLDVFSFCSFKLEFQ